jgi:hypothetical protein
MSERRHWFHCSDRFHGMRWIAQRIAPTIIAIHEPKTPRLCVAASVARCFAARLFKGDVYVYRTASPRRAIKPVAVYDAIITQERWLVPPVEMEMSYVIPAPIVHRACGAMWERLEKKLAKHAGAASGATPMGPSPLEQLYSFRDALDALGHEFADPMDRRFVNGCITYFEKRRISYDVESGLHPQTGRGAAASGNAGRAEAFSL